MNDNLQSISRDITKEILQEGQVFSHKNYFKFILKILEEEIIYEFFDRQTYYYPPNNRRKPAGNIDIKAIEVTDKIESFISDVNSKKLILLSECFNQRPIVGVAVKNMEHPQRLRLINFDFKVKF